MQLMILIPVLALLGLFGETVATATASHAQLEMSVEYPTRFRYKMLHSVTVSLVNISDEPLATVLVGFDRDYIERFSTVTFTPPVKHITEDEYLVEVTALEPGESRIISAAIQAEQYGKHTGVIAATSEHAEALQVSIETITFP
jgi:hypothetical protein